jgi:peroxiredoxin
MKLRYLVTVLLLYPALSMAQTSPKGLDVSQKAPEFSAKDQYGKLIRLSSELKKGPVVLVFYRGQWCPYCNRQLSHLEDSLGFITSKGATLIAVSPEKPANISKTIEKTKASYPILFDEGLKIMEEYDVAYALDSSAVDRYKKFGLDFNEANGVNGAHLPVPTVYIINQQGTIIFKHFDPDFKKRASVKEIISHL